MGHACYKLKWLSSKEEKDSKAVLKKLNIENLERNSMPRQSVLYSYELSERWGINPLLGMWLVPMYG